MTATAVQPPPPRVLVVDDDEGVRATLDILLADAGIEVLTAGDVNQGLDLFAAHRVDLVITDLQMPMKSGSEMISEVRRRNPRIPIIAMSGSVRAAKANAPAAASGGADRVIEKPFDCDALSALVRALLPVWAVARALGEGGVETAGTHGGRR